MGKEVILYGNKNCRFCVKTKEWLEKNKINFLYKDVSLKENNKEFNKYNVVGIPLVVLVKKDTNDKKLINGYSPEKLEKELLY